MIKTTICHKSSKTTRFISNFVGHREWAYKPLWVITPTESYEYYGLTYFFWTFFDNKNFVFSITRPFYSNILIYTAFCLVFTLTLLMVMFPSKLNRQLRVIYTQIILNLDLIHDQDNHLSKIIINDEIHIQLCGV